MPSLSSYPNVYNTCLVILQRRGFTLSCAQNDDQWFAEKGGLNFQADNPIELLGLIGVYEEIKPITASEYWWKIDEPDLISELDP